MEIARALILAGRAPHDRPWPSVRSGPKHLVPVAGRPVLFHNLDALRRANLLEAVVLVDPESREAVMRAVGDGSRWRLVVTYVSWEAHLGLGSALAASRDLLADEPVLVQPADALVRDPLHAHIAAFASERLDAMALRLPSTRGAERGVPLSGGLMLSARAISVLAGDDGDGEVHSTAADPLAGVRRHGGHVRVQDVDGCLPCHGDQDALLEGNRCMLERLVGDVDAAAFPSCEFQGPVVVHPTAQLEESLVRGPTVIGPRTRLSHSYVGPYTAIGADVTLEGCEIEHSIVLDEARLAHVGMRLETSVIGRGARVGRSFGLPRVIRLSVGEGAEVDLS